jgi:iron complex transport system substrate-binding protein
VPETFVADSIYGALAIDLGLSEGLLASPYDNIEAAYHNVLPGVSVDLGHMEVLHDGEYNFDKEVFYEFNPDVSLIDPNMMMNWWGFSPEDIEELSENAAPHVCSYLLRPEPAWNEGYPFYTLSEALEKVGRMFKEEERAQALREVRSELTSTISTETPDEPLTIGYMNANPAEETFNVWKPALPGVQGEVLRNIGVEDAFAGAYPEGKNVYDTDYEGILEVDPEIIVIKSAPATGEHLGYDSFQAYVEDIGSHPVGRELTAVKEENVIAGGPIGHGMVGSLFIHEFVAKQLYPETFGELQFTTIEALADIPMGEQLFDRQRVADIVNGDI